MVTVPARAARQARAPIDVLIVDDSAVARASLARSIGSHDELAVAAVVDNAEHAIAWLGSGRADVILLDLEMPGRGGLSAIPDLLAAGRGAHVLIVSSIAAAGAVSTIRALALGAADTLAKPGIGGLGKEFGTQLIDKVMRLGRAAGAGATRQHSPLQPLGTRPVGLLAIGASTGGLRALSDLFAVLPKRFDAPILVTQHLPSAFMPYFADQLTAMSGRPAQVATDGQPLLPATVVVAPGQAHVLVRQFRGRATLELSTAAAESRCCPSVDPMLASAATAFGAEAVGIVLSGMGRDGCAGAAAIVTHGGSVIVQNEASSAVWGMPGAIAKAGLASLIGTPAQLAEHLLRRGSAS